jgi:outer membrane protein, multidrug efflux system
VLRGIVVAFVGVALSSGSAEAARYTLGQLLAKVRVEYPGVIAAREGLASADAQLHQANRLWLPVGDLNFGITGSPSVQCQVTDPLTGNTITKDANGAPISEKARLNHCDSTGGFDFRSSDQFLPTHGVAFNLSLNLLQPLYTSGKIEAARSGARAGRDAAEDNVELARADVALNVARAYWGLKLARAIEGTIEEGRDKLKEWIATVEKNIAGNAPTYTESDRARLRIAFDNLELVLIDVRRNLRIALAGLRVLVGEEDADVDEEEIDVVEIKELPLSFYEDEARLHRPEAKLLDAAMSASRSFKRLKLSELLPDFGLSASFSYGYASAIDSPSNAFMSHANFLGAGLFLVMHQPLDIGMRLARLEQARADERAMEARRKQALGGIAWDVAGSYANLEEARLRYERLGHAEKVARGWYSAMDSQIDSGGAQSTRDSAEAARNYFELRIRHLQAIMDVNLALAQLHRVTGVN